MFHPNPFGRLVVGQIFETVLPDFVLSFAFFTAVCYAVLGRRSGHQRPAVVMSVAIGLALSIGLVSWEYANGWSIRNLGPVAVGFALIVLAGTMCQAIRGVGGNWAGAGIAFGASLLVGWTLGVDWPVSVGIVQTLIVVALLAGLLAFVGHRAGRHWLPHHPSAERAAVRHDMSDLEQGRRVAGRIWDGLSRVRGEADWLGRRPEVATDVMTQLRRILPAEGWLTERLAKLRANVHLLRAGHVARIRELRGELSKLSPAARRQAAKELTERCEELKLDVRLERLDKAVAETERRVRALTAEAQACLAAHEYHRVPGLLDEAVKLQGHNVRLIKTIKRTEARLLSAARAVAKQLHGVSDE